MLEYIRTHKRQLLILLFICTSIALLNIGVLVTEDLAHNYTIEWARYIVNEFTGTYTMLPLLLLLLAFFDRYPIREEQFLQGVLLYILVSVLYGVTHTTLMYLSRVPLYHLIGENDLTRYFDNLPYRYMMEYFKQFVAFWVAYAIYLIIVNLRKRQEEELRNAELQQELVRAQLQGLQAKLHPHFLFNTLNTISSVMYDNPRRADRLISKLSLFLRKMLDLENQHFHSLQEELSLLDHYTAIMQERYSDQLNIKQQVEEDTLSMPVPVLLLQPLIENAIKYSISQVEKAVVELDIRRKADRLHIRLMDNGPGLLKESVHKKGVGLNATFQRLDASYGEEYSFKMQNRKEGGLSIRIDLPINVKHV